MPDTVRIPILGKSMPKGAVLAGGAAVLGVGGLLVWRHLHPSTGTTPATTTGTGAYGYGSSAYAYGYGAYGYGASGNVTPYPYGEEYGYGAYGYGDYNPYTGQYLGGGTGSLNGSGGGTTTTTGPVAPTTNSEWSQAVISGLKGTKGYNELTILNALGRYLRGQNLSADQARIVTEATALEGDPPVPGANGYPPKMHSSPPKGQKKPGGGGPPPTHFIRANGHEDLYKIARDNNISENQIVGYNPHLRKYEGTGHSVPKGTRVKV
jgi:hypothetical protein